MTEELAEVLNDARSLASKSSDSRLAAVTVILCDFAAALCEAMERLFDGIECKAMTQEEIDRAMAEDIALQDGRDPEEVGKC